MTRFIVTVALGLLLPAVGQADLYVKKATHSTSYVEGEAVGTRQGDVTEMWIGDGKIASHEGNKTILLDLEKDWFCILNHPEKSYVETSLPLDVTKVLTEDLLSRYQGAQTSGEVEKEDHRREMVSRECREYRVSYWDMSDGQRSNERTLTVWATDDVDFDKKVYSSMLDCMRMLHNRDKKLRKELRKIKGLQTGYEVTSNGSGVESKLTSEVVEVTEAKPPKGTYSVPEGYTKKERLNDRDF
jgi:hypothetical protein